MVQWVVMSIHYGTSDQLVCVLFCLGWCIYNSLVADWKESPMMRFPLSPSCLAPYNCKKINNCESC